MSSTILDGAVVKENAMLAAGSLLTQKKIINAGELWAGKHAKFLRKLKKNEIEVFRKSADNYFLLGQEYLVKLNKNN